MITWIRAWLAARRIGLRDKGGIERELVREEDGYAVYSVWRHTSCRTRLRVGIKDGRPVHWCWRCEQITSSVSTHSNPPPGAESDAEKDNNKVVPLLGRQRK